ncbi:MAG: bifunctional precorrin-2 dehydrogenase/sirohydrochlorin ferrochelatase [Lachnospiraceae bacterium]|nr:bifunctional precorrin-2 dehydrogenase/sirohydrochlorin ferrochelatase [Lachnospiraceae bacterium]
MKKEKMYFPVFISLEEKKCVVIGGGEIAARRVETLLNFCENITVIAPEICEKMKKLIEKNEFSYYQRSYQSGDCKEAFLVVVATDNRWVNKQAGEEGKAAGALVSVADNREECNFLFPGIVANQESGAVIGVCSSGRNHKLAKALTDKCKKIL